MQDTDLSDMVASMLPSFPIAIADKIPSLASTLKVGIQPFHKNPRAVQLHAELYTLSFNSLFENSGTTISNAREA
jgi:hypothetical protein